MGQWHLVAGATGEPCVLHVLDVETEVRWARVCERNLGESATFSFVVTREMFDLMEARWEAPAEEECAEFASQDDDGVVVNGRSVSAVRRE